MDNSQEISHLIFSEKKKMYLRMSFAAVEGALTLSLPQVIIIDFCKQHRSR